MVKHTKKDNNFIYYWVGKNIKKQRKIKGTTQKELIEKCNYIEKLRISAEGQTH